MLIYWLQKNKLKLRLQMRLLNIRVGLKNLDPSRGMLRRVRKIRSTD